VILRYSNVYGPRQSSSGEGGVVAIFINKILNGKKPIIFGSGQQTRDFLYVDDAIEAAILALKAKPGLIYNVGTNKEITINDLLKLISKILDKKVKPIFKPQRQGEIIKSRIDYSKIKKELNWRPKCELEEGLKKTIDWFFHRN
jgi:UDP-glucose 4-epimerase